MVIKIECDSEIKHLSIDFGEHGTQTTTIVENNDIKTTTSNLSQKPQRTEQALDLDTDYDLPEQEVMEKPVILEEQREVLVSDDMMNAEY